MAAAPPTPTVSPGACIIENPEVVFKPAPAGAAPKPNPATVGAAAAGLASEKPPGAEGIPEPADENPVAPTQRGHMLNDKTQPVQTVPHQSLSAKFSSQAFF